ncbi:MAG: hypothetical protein HRT55_07855 [Colwellia sp.]|uniref:hypothetical protein n=1 Tax=Alteromonadales TaxID=135622 RepID=UPI001DD93740|nr:MULTISPECIES: hypothetical protein [Alteromonadales]NQZ26213.1 hypothetical protein [Colwellia sp.]NRA80591.1 hypothetical protein [Pseudoalteromonas sp.]
MVIKKNITDLHDSINMDVDYFLTCASFEDRCLTIVEGIDHRKISNVLMFYVKQFERYTLENRNKIKSLYQDKVQELPYGHDRPTDFADLLLSKLEEITDKSLIVDISTFTRESLLILVKFFDLHRARFKSVNLFYRAAEVNQILSKGIIDVRSVLGYMGDIEMSKPLHLIVLNGFEFERAKYIIDVFEPDYISIGCGSQSGSINTELHDRNVEFTNKLIAYYPKDNISLFEHSLQEPELTRDTLLEVVNSKPDCNSVIAPLNNKLSTLGAGLAAIKNPSVQLCYTQAADYNVNYSKKLDDVYIYKLV